ncbi:MAG: hypothetical protein WC926_04900 [Candidatus Paceibacterota bacterium]|jgi:hypothetical protein
MLPVRHPVLESKFPQLSITGYKITSPSTPSYNCIAWAAKDDTRFWWPRDDEDGYYWPDGIEKKETIEVFIEAYRSVGFDICDNADFDNHYEKIAIYVNSNGVPTHGARMLDEKTWTSKLGQSFDISHTIDGLNGDEYGSPKVFMRRKLV